MVKKLGIGDVESRIAEMKKESLGEGEAHMRIVCGELSIEPMRVKVFNGKDGDPKKMVSEDAMMNMMWGALSQQYDSLPDRAKLAFSQLEIDVEKQPNQLRIVARAEGKGEDVERAAKIMIENLSRFLPEYINKVFRVGVNFYGD